MGNTKESIWHKTSTMVMVYAISYAVIMLIQAGLMIFGQAVDTGKIVPTFITSLLNAKVEMPLEALSIIWVALASAYIGVDRGAYAVKTSTLEYGKQDVGDPRTLRQIILVSGLLFMEGITLSTVCAADFQLTQLASAFGTTTVLYVIGQKAIKITKYAGSGPNPSLEQLHEVQDNIGKDVPFAAAVAPKTDEEIVADRISDAISDPETKAAKDTAMKILKEDAKSVIKDIKNQE